MVRLEPLTADDPRSRALLEEYFRMRAAAFPQGQAYQPVFPATSVFTPPAGVFLVVVDDDGAEGIDTDGGKPRKTAGRSA